MTPYFFFFLTLIQGGFSDIEVRSDTNRLGPKELVLDSIAAIFDSFPFFF